MNSLDPILTPTRRQVVTGIIASAVGGLFILAVIVACAWRTF